MSLTKIGSIGINTGIAFAGVTTIVTLNTANDALSIGATVNVGSGITLGASGDIFATGVSTVTTLKVGSGVTVSSDGDVFATGVTTSTTFSGAFSGSGANITAINASNIGSGTVPTARLGSGTASSSTFLRGDSTFAAVTSTTINSNTNNYLITGTGTADTLQGESGLTYDGDTLTNDAALRNIQAGSNYVLIGSSNAGGVTLGLDGDSNGDGAGTDYAFIEHDSSGDLNIVADNPADASNIIFKTNSTSERLRINSSGQIGIGANNNSDYDASARNVLIASGGTTGITIKSGGSSYYGAIHFADGTSSAAEYRAGRLLYEHSTNSFLLYNANAFSLKIDGDGDVGIGDNSPASRLTVTKTNASGDVGVRVKNNTATDGSAASPTTASLYLNTSTGTFNTFYIQARRYDNDTWMGYADPTTAGHIPTLCLTNDKRVGINTHVPKCSLQNSSPGLHIIGRGVDPTPHYDSYANLVVESIESRLLLCSTSGGSNASSIILSAAASSTDNRHWIVEGSGADQSYQLHLGYMQTTSNTHFDSGLVTPQISITTAGNVGINKQNPSDKLVVVGAITQENTSTSNTSSQLFFNNDVSGGAYRVRFDSNNSTVGSIQVNTSSTVYNTSSDYRLKENITAISDGITRLKTLKPSRFNWKIDSSTTIDGFIAHEVTAVPEAVSGTKDEVATEDSKEAKKGDPIYQQIDHSKLVPLLTAALQEAITKIETLETKVATLEG